MDQDCSSEIGRVEGIEAVNMYGDDIPGARVVSIYLPKTIKAEGKGILLRIVLVDRSLEE